MQSSEFTKSIYFGNNLKKKLQQNKKIKKSPKKGFLYVKLCFLIWKKVDSDRSERDLSDHKKSYDKKTAENWRNLNDVEKHIVSKL